MAYYYKLEGTALEARKRMLEAMTSKAKTELRAPVIRRQLRPEDVGLTGEWSFATGGTGWVDYIASRTVADNTFLGIYGIRNLTTSTPQAVTQLRVTRAGSLVRYYDIQGINQLENPEVFFDDPITIDQNVTMKIEAYARASATEKLALIGDVVEKVGILIDAATI